MPINEEIVTGKKMRVWDAVASKWKRFSYWTKATDVEMNDGSSVEDSITDVQDDIADLNNDLVERTSLAESSGTVFAETGTYDGRVLLKQMYGNSVQDGTPTPSVPVAIKSAKASFYNRGKNLIIPFSLSEIKTQSTVGTWTDNKYSRYGVDFTINDDDTITINGTATGDTYLMLSQSQTLNNYHLPRGVDVKLVLNGDKNLAPLRAGLTNNGQIVVSLIGGDSTVMVSGHAMLPDKYEGSTTLYIRVPSGYTVNNVTISLMFVLNNVTDYSHEPYQGQTIETNDELRSLEVTGTSIQGLANHIENGHYYIADTKELIDGEYKNIRRIGRLVLKGSENITWTKSTSVTGFYNSNFTYIFETYGTGKPYYLDNFDAPSPTFCNRYQVLGRAAYLASTENYYFSFYRNAGGPYINFKSSAATSAEFNTWLSTNNVEILYVLETPYIEEVSDSDAQKLLSLKSYDEATYIAQTEDVEGQMTIAYGSSELSNDTLTALANSQQNDAEISILSDLNYISYDYATLVQSTTYTSNEDTGEIVITEKDTNAFQQIILDIPCYEDLVGKEVTLSYDSITYSSSRTADWNMFLLSYVGSTESIIITINGNTSKNRTVTIPNNVIRLRVLLRLSQGKTATTDDYVIWRGVQLRLGNKVLPYKPFSLNSKFLTDRCMVRHAYAIPLLPPTSVTTSTTFAKTGLTFTLNKGGMVRVVFEFNNARPEELGIINANSGTNHVLYAHTETGSDTKVGQLMLFTYLPSGNYEIMAKSVASGANAISVNKLLGY